jgi:protein-S-isoprenylcysteine O-methyltransferase Ste14
MEKRHFYILSVLQVFAVIALFWFLATFRSPWNAQRYVGTALAILGVSFVLLARYQLGTSFAVQAEAHELITTGLYSRIRNPIYVFGMIMLVGVVLVLHQPVGWLVIVAGVIGQTIRARREARVLEAAFGDAYREYRRKTWF